MCGASSPSVYKRRNAHQPSLDFQQHFREILRHNSPTPRPFYVHLTSVIVSRLILADVLAHDVLITSVPKDTQATADTLGIGER
jgi:hypothetical protein